MNLMEFYKAVGGDYNQVILRLPSEAMIQKYLNRFLDDPSYGNLKEAWEKGRIQDAFLAAHTLKGTAANLGLDQLAQAASDLTEELRQAVVLPSEDGMKKVTDAYETVRRNHEY